MKDKDLFETKAQGYKVENGKLVYFSNMLDGYKHEYKDLKEICEEMNGLLKSFNSYEQQLVFWKGKAEEKLPKDSVVLSGKEYEQLQQSYIVKAYDKLRAKNKELLKIKENCLEIMKQGEQQIINIRKETAEKILQYVYDRCIDNKFIRKFEEFIKEQFGVEIKE